MIIMFHRGAVSRSIQYVQKGFESGASDQHCMVLDKGGGEVGV